MSDETARLMALARTTAEQAYAPYSQFRVGAVVVGADGSEHTGVNVENAAYGSTVCAEANAITTAVSAGVRRIDTVVVAGPNGGECYPCGNCRQLMQEFGVREVIVQDGDGGYRVHSCQELLPHSFGPQSLE